MYSSSAPQYRIVGAKQRRWAKINFVQGSVVSRRKVVQDLSAISLIAIANERCVILGGFFKSAGLTVTDNHIGAAFDGFPDTSAVDRWIMESERGFSVNDDRSAAAGGFPSVLTAAISMNTTVPFADSGLTVDGHIG